MKSWIEEQYWLLEVGNIRDYLVSVVYISSSGFSFPAILDVRSAYPKNLADFTKLVGWTNKNIHGIGLHKLYIFWRTNIQFKVRTVKIDNHNLSCCLEVKKFGDYGY